MRRLAPVLCLAVSATTAGAQGGGSQARPPDEIYASLSGEDLAPGGTGAALSVGWLHRFSPRFSSDVALSSEGAAGTRWSYGRAAGFGWLTPRVHLRGGASLGAGERGAETLRYRRFVGALGVMLVPGRVYAEVESQYLDFEELGGHLLRPQVSAFLTPSLSVNAAYFVSTSARLDIDALSLRVDLHREGWSPFAGALVGRVDAAALDSFPGVAAPVSSQAYAGLRVPLGRHELTLMAERSRAGESTRLRLSVTWRVPL